MSIGQQKFVRRDPHTEGEGWHPRQLKWGKKFVYEGKGTTQVRCYGYEASKEFVSSKHVGQSEFEVRPTGSVREKMRDRAGWKVFK